MLRIGLLPDGARFRLNVGAPVLTYAGRGCCMMPDGTEINLDVNRVVEVMPDHPLVRVAESQSVDGWRSPERSARREYSGFDSFGM